MRDKSVEIITPRDAADIDAVRQLCWDYRDYLLTLGPLDVEIVQTFYPLTKYAQVLERLETAHTAPNGAMRLALVDGLAVGCAMVQTTAAGDAEIKRVFVDASARGLGVGRALMLALITDCRELGFRRILMDTGKPLEAATKLYLDMGFRLRGPYQEMPAMTEGRLLFFEMDL